ncbi:cytochrome c5 family protein [Psychrobacter sp. NG254]|uniref:c-type cytochrome n=1 Tax=Psychrobacter sp. NG254 TaxID=2782003 RepID=UPI0018881B7A|nr:c-type cytochrome [Psychrobacter sp. NG254]MBF2719110.1 cytochrome c5 family protein [Psychrobacter sp. NG254]
MIGIPQHMHKLSLSILSLSMLLALSACSDNTPTDKAADIDESTDVAVVAEAEPAVEPATATPDTVSQSESAAEDVIVPEVAAEPEVLAVDAGAKLYESNCKVCHAAGLLDAPKYGDTAAWSARVTKDKETLYMHSAKGFNKMPAQAVNDVTEAQVKAAVDYMLASVS